MLFTSARRRIYASPTNASSTHAYTHTHAQTYSHTHTARTRTRTQRAVHRGFHVHPSQSRLRGDAPLRCRRRASRVLSSSTPCLLPGRHFKGRRDTRSRSSNVRLTAMRDRRVSGYSFKNYSYSPRTFKRFEGDLSTMFPRDKRISRSLRE